jgi:hypothetical protein
LRFGVVFLEPNLCSSYTRERVSDSPAMISAPRVCPKCSAEIPSDAPEGGCPHYHAARSLCQPHRKRGVLAQIVGPREFAFCFDIDLGTFKSAQQKLKTCCSVDAGEP